MNPSKSDKQTSETRREEIEGRFTRWRIKELEASPVVGNFDAAHLKEINRRIFQDLPGAGCDEVRPGEFRPPVPKGNDWMKQRGLAIADGAFFVAYSRMDKVALARLDKVLEDARPTELRKLKTAEFAERIATIYVELDYVHPFDDGNSRTLRTFTRQLARESGYEVDWERFNRADVGRDLLYIARDRSVNELAKPHIQHESTMRNILYTQDRTEGNQDLPDLLRDAVRPSRAVAFECLTEQAAVKEHPELEEAYQTLRTAAAYFESKMPGKPEAQEVGIESVMTHVQARLNAGETTGFSRGSELEKQERQERQTSQ